jgi:hypothetical protein
MSEAAYHVSGQPAQDVALLLFAEEAARKDSVEVAHELSCPIVIERGQHRRDTGREL